MTSAPTVRHTLKQLLDRPSTVPVVLCTTLVLTLLASLMLYRGQQQQAVAEFQFLAQQQQQQILTRLNAYQQLLQGGVALFDSSEDVTRTEWQVYARSQRITETLPGLQAFGFYQRIEAAEKRRHEQSAHADGLSDYHIWPAGERERYVAIAMLEPLTPENRAALGYDGYSEPVRRAAMQQAGDSGRIVASGKVQLIQDGSRETVAGVIVFLPVYRHGMPVDSVAGRRAALNGFVYGAFRVGDLMQSLLSSQTQNMRLQLYQQHADTGNLLFDSSPGRMIAPARFSTELPLEFAGQRWIARFQSLPTYVPRQGNSANPWLLLGSGLLLNLLLFAVMRAHIRHRRKLEATAAELQASRDRFSALVQNVPGMVFRSETAPPWRVVFMSGEHEISTGQPVAQFLSGQLIYRDLIHPDDLSRIEAIAIQAITEHRGYEIEYRVRHCDGTWRWASLNGRAIYADDGTPQFVDGVVFDITARRQAQQDLRDLTDHLPVAVYRYRLEAGGVPNLMYISETVRRLIGIPAADLMADPALFFAMIHPDDMQRFVSADREASRTLSDFAEEVRIILTDGSVHWLFFNSSPFTLADGSVAYHGFIEDITARKQIEQRIRQSESLLQQIFDTSSVAIFLVDKQGTITHANRRMAEMFRCPLEQLVGSPYVAHIHPKERDIGQRKMLALLASDIDSVDLERRYWRDDGSEFWGNLTGKRFYDVDGAERGLLGVIMDVTERRTAEDELRIAATTFQIQDGIMVTDAAGVILQVNPAFTETTGYSAAEAIGRDPSLLRSSRHDAAFFSAMWAELLQTGKWQGELWNRRKNGEEYPEWLTITAVRDTSGQVTHYVGAFHDITERKAAEEEIRNLAFYDPLTRLPNRRLLLDRLQQGLATSARSGLYGALIFIDLDNFKTLNDTLGHDIGDQLLIAVARRLHGSVREGDTVARLGGDEFIVMLGGLHESAVEAAAMVESIGHKIISELNPPYHLSQHELRSTPSLGITLFRGHEASVDELLKRADMAMYQAKAAGRNTLVFFDPAMQARINARALMESELYRAIENQEFLLHYQPQVDAGGNCIGVEALLRWYNPQRGMVSPAQFIPVAEETGQILAIGHWVLLQACRQQVIWQQHPATEYLEIAINVSAKQFHLPMFVDELRQLIQHTGANPGRLKLELTESMLLSDVNDAIVKMNALQALGIGFALDDFGTGYSSLSYLKRLPLDQMKIDQSFVRDLLTDPNDRAICRAVIALAKSLGLRVIAEGVETDSQWQLLQSDGCDEAQGYLFAKPLPVAELERWLQQRQRDTQPAES